MIEVVEMGNTEIDEVLKRVGYAHLGCARDNRPYVVPINYAYDGTSIFIYTTEGKKSEIIDGNPAVCLQIEEVEDAENWRSVIVNGDAERLTDEVGREKAMDAIVKENPHLTPAVSIHWLDSWVRENVEAIYRIEIATTTGKRCAGSRDRDAVLVSRKKGKLEMH